MTQPLLLDPRQVLADADARRAQAAQVQQTAAPSPVEREIEEIEAEQARLEAEHSKGATAGLQLARGALDALLFPGALIGMGAEGVGELTGADTVRKFGRDLGRASSGKSAIESLAFVFGGETKEAQTAADRARKTVEEQEKAWPMLSTVSKLSGSAIPALATGGLATGASGAATVGQIARSGALVGAYEGAGAGAQTAYEANAALRDVMAASLAGGVLGAGVGAAGGALSAKARPRKADLADVFGQAAKVDDAGDSWLQQFAEERTAKALGFRGSDLKKLGKSATSAESEFRQIARDVLEGKLDDGTDILPKGFVESARLTGGDLAERVKLAETQTGEKLGALRDRLSAYIDEAAPELRPKPLEIAERIQREVVDPLRQSVVPDIAAKAGKVEENALALLNLGDDVSLSQLQTVRQQLDDVIFPKAVRPGLPPQAPAHADELIKMRRIIEETIEQTTDAAASRMAPEAVGELGKLKRLYRSYRQAAQVSGAGELQDLGNRRITLSDYMVGAATLAGDVATGGAMSAVKAAGAAVVHKYFREHSSTVLASLAHRFSRTAAHVPIERAGGIEAQAVLRELQRVKTFVRETTERAGANPEVRAAAEAAAKDVSAELLAKKAGEFVPTTWADKAPTPLQKLVYRTQILDQVADDVAADATQAATLRPALNFEIAPERVARLAKDADAPLAIGTMQARAKSIAQEMPEQLVQSPIGQRLERTALELQTADAAQAMASGHALARDLLDAAARIPDPAVQGFLQRQARAIMDELGGEAFGQAGTLYRQLAAPPTEAFGQLAQREAVREALRTTRARGALAQVVSSEVMAIEAAHAARRRLSGELSPEGLSKALRALEKRATAAEEAVTLDGLAVGRVADQLGEREVPAGGTGGIVLDALSGRLRRIARLARGVAREDVEGQIEDETFARVLRASSGAAIRWSSLSTAEQRAEYDRRLEYLANAARGGDPERVTEATQKLPQVPSELETVAASDAQQKLQQLLADMPKPRPSIRGKAFETLSLDELRRANAMWEATIEPLSVFSDFERGAVDYDKVQYAWRQYPGLQQAAQAGIVDIFSAQLDDDAKAGIPDQFLTQLDNLLGFGGQLQPSVSQPFAAHITFLAEQEAQAQQQSAQRPLSLPTSRASFTERLAGKR